MEQRVVRRREICELSTHTSTTLQTCWRMTEVSFTKIQTNESFEMKIFQDQNILLTKSEYLTGKLSKINDLETQNLTDEDLQTILPQTLNTITINPCTPTFQGKLRLQNHILYIGIADGPIGIELAPLSFGEVCGGLKVTSVGNQTIFMKDDLLVSINNIQIENINVNRAVELLRTTTDRTVTIIRSSTPESVQPQQLTKDFPQCYIPQNVLIARSKSKKSHPRCSLTFYRDYICDIEKRFSARPSFEFIPFLDSDTNK
jgi:hypothetical protein